MSKQDYLTEDPIISSQKYYCVSFFNKLNVKQTIDNNKSWVDTEIGLRSILDGGFQA